MKTLIEIENLWREPPPMYRPFVRWWWFSGGITKKEIARELHEIAAKGFGGVEIQPIYSALKGGPLEKLPEIHWLSDEWLDFIAFTVSESKKLKLQVDLTFGSGWPFGGPHIPEEYASTKLQRYSMPLDKQTILDLALDELNDKIENIQGLFALNIKGSNLILNHNSQSLIDLLPLVKNNRLIWEIPEGSWRLIWFVSKISEQKVKRAAPGAEGFVLDHLNKLALDLHVQKIAVPLQKKLADNLGLFFGAFFCDSWEVADATWTKDFKSQFQTKLGYDLTPYLPILFPSQNTDEFITLREQEIRVKYDYLAFRSELILNQFFTPFVEACHNLGVKARVQPYSASTDLLKAYGLLDICEIEGFGKEGIGTLYYGALDPRLASSGAHIYNKDLVSCESFTWLKEHFHVTLEDLKHEADQIILHGIHRLIFHGFPYSPPEAGIPGWVFYASIMANHNSTWWPYIGELTQYIAQNAVLAHQGRVVSDLAVYIPYHDDWSGNKDILRNIRIQLKTLGLLTAYDYVNDDRIQNGAKFDEGVLFIGTGQYKVLLLVNTDYLPLKTAEEIEKLVHQGLQLICIGKLPSKAPGLFALKNGESIKVETIFNSLYQKFSTKNVSFLSNFDLLPDFLISKGVIPDFLAIGPDGNYIPFEYLHIQHEIADFYFVLNGNSEHKNISLKLRANGTTAEVWNSITGEMFSLSSIRDKQKRINIAWDFDAFQSLWFVIRKDSTQSRPKKEELTEVTDSLSLTGPWQITFQSPPNIFPRERSFTIEKNVQHLFDWTTDPDVQYFSGTALYVIDFKLDAIKVAGARHIFLDLGQVYEIAEISLNWRPIQTLWQGVRKVEITRAARAGENVLAIAVTNLLINRIIGYEQKGIKWRSDYYFVNRNYKDFNAKTMPLRPSGLIGPVKIIFEK